MRSLDWILSCGIAAALALPLHAQDSRSELPPKQQSTKQPGAAKAVRSATVERLIEELGADDYRARKAAETELSKLGKSARASLEVAAKEHADTEVRWRARRLVDRLKGTSRGLAKTPNAKSNTPNKLRRPDPKTDPLRTLREQLRALEAQLEGMHARPGEGFSFNLSPGSQSSKVEIGPRGVRVEVSEPGKDGKLVPRVYEASDMEAFREKHPEIAKRYLGRSGFSIDRGFLSGGPSSGRPFSGGLLRPRRLNMPPAPAIPPQSKTPSRGRVLGVMVGAVSPQIADYLGLAAGTGLLVNSVVDDSLAAQMGIVKGDIILAIADTEIHGQPDVARALGGIAKGAEVKLELIRRGRELVLKGKKLENSAPKKLRPRKIR